jgi:hypothetical protein
MTFSEEFWRGLMGRGIFMESEGREGEILSCEKRGVRVGEMEGEMVGDFEGGRRGNSFSNDEGRWVGIMGVLGWLTRWSVNDKFMFEKFEFSQQQGLKIWKFGFEKLGSVKWKIDLGNVVYNIFNILNR